MQKMCQFFSAIDDLEIKIANLRFSAQKSTPTNQPFKTDKSSRFIMQTLWKPRFHALDIFLFVN